MSPQQSHTRRLVSIIVVLAAFLALGPAESHAQPPIFQPGAPGEPSRQISAEEASDLAGIQFSDADVKFLQGMIAHHAQALEMTTLLTSHSEQDTMRRFAQRIRLSQEDEITMMQGWLRARGEDAPTSDPPRMSDTELMPGMLSESEMGRLELARGTEFDRLFLEFMIKHHQGALTMVRNLLSQRGTAQESQLFAFTSDITADQGMEIDRMDAMLVGFSSDPRVGLTAGFYDAGEASLNMELVTTLPKPDGFYDPSAEANRPVSRGRRNTSSLL